MADARDRPQHMPELLGQLGAARLRHAADAGDVGRGRVVVQAQTRRSATRRLHNVHALHAGRA